MSENFAEKETSLREQVEQSETALQACERALQAIDNQLLVLARKKPQYDLLAKACESIEELDSLDAAHLFWGANQNSVDRLAHARRAIGKYNSAIAEAEGRRQTIVDKIGGQNDNLYDLNYELQNVIAQEQRRKNNWVIEREPSVLPRAVQVMPWSRGFEEDRRFHRSLAGSVAAAFGIAILVGSIAIPVVERTMAPKLPERVAKLVREQRIPPPPAPVADPVIPQEELPKTEPKPETKPEPDPEKRLVQEQTPESTSEPIVAEVSQPGTKERIRSKGILAFRDSFAGRASLKPIKPLGSQATLSTGGAKSVGRSQRMMVTTSAPGSSGGINLASISRDVGGGGGGGNGTGGYGLDGVDIGRVASSIGGGDGPGRPRSGGGASAGRTDEEIQIVFDRYKAALYRMYNRELRKDPTLRGQIVLRLTIQPDGSVSLCELQASDMNAPSLAQRIVDRVSTFDFGAKENIVSMTIIYPIDFLPSA